jgi:phage I-like protein
MAWFKRSDGALSPEDDRRKKDDIEIDPAKLKSELTEDFNKGFEKFQTEQDEKLKPVLEMAASLKADKEAREKAAKDAADKKTADDNKIDDTDWMLDPAAAVAASLKPTQNAVISLAARQARADLLGEKEYYYGELKTKIDQMITAQPLSAQMNPVTIENCYKLVLFDHQKDIAEGKIKSRNNAASFESNGTGGHGGKGKGDGDNEVMSAEEKHAASALGISEADWKSTRKEMSYV